MMAALKACRIATRESCLRLWFLCFLKEKDLEMLFQDGAEGILSKILKYCSVDGWVGAISTA